MKVCVLSDLHLQPPLQLRLALRLQVVKQAVSSCELLIYSGDILTMDDCPSTEACAAHYELARHVVDTVAKPFMFTLGNHDGVPGLEPRLRLQQQVAASSHHVGQCDATLNACVHPTLGIATLDSGRQGCHPETFYGCEPSGLEPLSP